MDKTLLLWLWFAEVMGPARHGALSLLYEFGYLQEIYEQRGSLALVKLLKPHEINRAENTTLEMMERRLDFCRKNGIEVITYDDMRYPERLRRISDPPLVLFCTGNADILNQVDVAAVGSRNMTRYGKEAVRFICEPLAKAGVVIASGLALGTDAEVHSAALKAGGRTVAVLGNGIDTTEPRRHRELRQVIERGGAVISEFPPGAGCGAWMFPVRNRIVSGLARAVMIFEAAKRSGTMITANYALGDGREVFALPGSILSAQSGGPNALIRDGAAPLLSHIDVLEFLGISAEEKPREKTPEQPVLEGDAALVWNSLGSEALGADELSIRTGLSMGELLAALTEMELEGTVNPLPGGKYERRL